MLGAMVAVVIVGGGSFYAGMSYAKGQASSSPTTRVAGGAGFAGRGGAARGGTGGGFTAGQILSVNNGSITIQSAMSSSTEIVLTSPSTQIVKTVSGSASDLTTGASIVVTGSMNSDGSLSAQSIQIRPAGMGGGFGGGRGGGAGTGATGATQ